MYLGTQGQPDNDDELRVLAQLCVNHISSDPPGPWTSWDRDAFNRQREKLAGYGIELGPDPNQLSEVRAPGGALLVLGALMLIGVFSRAYTFASTSIAAAVYLAYGLSRLVSFALDGLPGEGLLVATAFELALGSACAFALLRASRTRTETAPELA